MPVPFSFGAATTAIPLSQLDSNFNTPITLGNTAIQLGNTVTTLNNMTLANVTITSGNVTITSGNVTVTNANVTSALTLSGLTASTALALDASKNVVSVTNTGTGNNVLSASPTLTGTVSAAAVTLSSDLTLNGGTANGVAYLNGSKVLTTGSALTFDGSNLETTGNVTLANNRSFRVKNTGGTAQSLLTLGNDDNVYMGQVSNPTAGALFAYAAQHIYIVGASEGMRLTSTGLGIGTSSPVYKLTTNVTGGSATALFKTDQSTADLYLQASGTTFTYSVGIGASANSLRFMSGSLGTTMLLDSSGNLGLGVTPSAWGSNERALQLGNSLSLIRGSSSEAVLAYNAFVNSSGSYIYNITTNASRYEQLAGQHRFYTAPSGTAGNTISFTQAMTLDASGNLGIGTTSPSNKLVVSASGAAGFEVNPNGIASAPALIAYNRSTSAYIQLTTLASQHVWQNSGTEVARIDTNGNWLVGTTNASASAGSGFKVLPANNGADSPQVAIVTAASTNTTASLSLYSTGAGAYRFYVADGGTIYATSTAITGISDVRVKENIRDLDDGLTAVMALKPRKFDWKAGKGKGINDDRGFIAQEFEQVFPDLIDEWKDPAPEGEEPYKAVRADLIPVLVKAIQELKAEFDAYKATHP